MKMEEKRTRKDSKLQKTKVKKKIVRKDIQISGRKMKKKTDKYSFFFYYSLKKKQEIKKSPVKSKTKVRWSRGHNGAAQ